MTVHVNEQGYLEYPTVFISDMHLGKKHAQADMLYEFLSRLKCEKLYIVGDAIEGWGLMKKKHRKFNEMSLRVFDCLNAMAARGVEIILLPGNHDERLRTDWDSQQRRFKKPKPWKRDLFRRSVLDQHHEFKDKISGRSARFYLTDEALYVDPKGRRMRVLHGDQFDPRYLKDNKILSKIGDGAYDFMIWLNGHVSKFCQIFNSHFSLSRLLKSEAKKYFKVSENFEAELAREAEGDEFDGLVCGHIHTATVNDEHGVLYVNSGDWVESCTAAMHDADGNWLVLDWMEVRAALGFTARASELDVNPYRLYRGVTQQQLKWIQRIWPAKDYFHRYSAVKAARRKIWRIRRQLENAWDIGCGIRQRLHGVRLARLENVLGQLEDELLPYERL
jgi:UDP-2,3-diacylglucosamine pyrophosphatase LpxH